MFITASTMINGFFFFLVFTNVMYFIFFLQITILSADAPIIRYKSMSIMSLRGSLTANIYEVAYRRVLTKHI